MFTTITESLQWPRTEGGVEAIDSLKIYPNTSWMTFSKGISILKFLNDILQRHQMYNGVQGHSESQFKHILKRFL